MNTLFQNIKFGFRIAVGSRSKDIITLVLQKGVLLSLFGLTGLVGALALTRILGTMLHNVSPFDPVSFVVVSIFLLVVSTMACFIPARRAAKVDLMNALRCD